MGPVSNSFYPTTNIQKAVTDFLLVRWGDAYKRYIASKGEREGEGR